ncbi:glycosyltransferase [Cupriavidus sp. IK-TO18]|uniref:glycosyltransferase family 2 protein n=1 Tax=Cupriavidus sp. IK-TO18 TaxID=2782182 RepID=UPI001899DBBC|nr:glycosyltransferase [Cupriavidus sp. IK-TO18]MBF6988824.1 glycosyltransferase [Cupriavidus sp. IK-TO18]
MSLAREEAGHAAPLAKAVLPPVSLLLITYNQEAFIAHAIRGALAQDYPDLEILISDDASTDTTFAAARQALEGYEGPHKVTLLRNPENLGISAHLSKLVAQSHGELIFVAAGDDFSLPTRCSEVVRAWQAHGGKPDLIVTDLVDMAHDGTLHGDIRHSDLEPYVSFEYWAAHPPHVIGASHTWTRRMFERFGPIAPGMMSEDQITTLRASLMGGALNVRRPLVHYRRGGTSGKRKWRTPADFVQRIRFTNRSSLAETLQFIADAERAGCGNAMRELKARKLAREQYTADIFSAPDNVARLKVLFGARRVTLGHRLRMFLYAAVPSAYAPFYFLGNLFRRG